MNRCTSPRVYAYDMEVPRSGLAGIVVTARRPRGTTTLWTLRKNEHTLTADIVGVEDRWELRLFTQDALLTWQGFALRGSAVASADRIQQDLELDCWQ